MLPGGHFFYQWKDTAMASELPPRHMMRSSSKGRERREFRASPMKRDRRDEVKKKESRSIGLSPSWVGTDDWDGPWSVLKGDVPREQILTVSEDKQLGTKPLPRNSHVAGIFNDQMMVCTVLHHLTKSTRYLEECIILKN